MDPLNTLQQPHQASLGNRNLNNGRLKKMPSLAELRLRLRDKLPAGALDEPPQSQAGSIVSPTETIGRLAVSPRMSPVKAMSPRMEGQMLPPTAGLMMRAASTNSMPTLAVIGRRFSKANETAGYASPTPTLSINTSMTLPAPASESMARSKSAPESPAPISATSCHPLQRPWTLYGDTKQTAMSAPTPITPKPSQAAYAANVARVGTVTSVEAFARLMNWCKRPSLLLNGANISFFRDGIHPTWEDGANAKGGKWTILLKGTGKSAGCAQERVDELWFNLLLMLVGEQMEPEEFVTGAVCSVRDRGHRIQVWVKERTDLDKINQIGRQLASCLGLADGMHLSLDFAYHQGSASGIAHKLFKISPAINPVTQPLLSRSISMPASMHIPIPTSPQKSPLGFSGFLPSPTFAARAPPSPRSWKAVQPVTDENRNF